MRRILLLLAGALCCLVLSPGARSQNVLGEYQAKAAFLFNFPKFVEWPPQSFASPTAPINICVIGDDPFGADLDAIINKVTMGHPVQVSRNISLNVAGNCQILFISASEEDRLKPLLSSLKRAPILTVSDMAKFAERGGMINLLVENGRIKMEVNIEAAQLHGLKISSQLLKLARVVRGENPP